MNADRVLRLICDDKKAYKIDDMENDDDVADIYWSYHFFYEGWDELRQIMQYVVEDNGKMHVGD